MKSRLKLCAGAAALAAATGLAACSEQRDAGGLTAEENEKLNKAAESSEIVDTSPDSAVPASDEWDAAEAGEAGEATGNSGGNNAQ
jgi:uncharacterized protein YaiE (UPF0345 family)